MSDKKNDKPTPTQIANAEQIIRESPFPPQVKDAFVVLAEALAQYWASTPPCPQPTDFHGGALGEAYQMELSAWSEKYAVTFSDVDFPPFPPFVPQTKYWVSRWILTTGKRYAIQFPDEAAFYVITLPDGEVVDSGMNAGKTRQHHTEIVSALNKKIPIRPSSGRPRGSNPGQKARDYMDLYEKRLKSNIKSDRQWCEETGTKRGKLQRAKDYVKNHPGCLDQRKRGSKNVSETLKARKRIQS